MEELIQDFMRHDLEAIKASGSDDFNKLENIDEGINEIFEFIIEGKANEIKLITANNQYSKSLGTVSVTFYTGQYEVNYPDGSNIYTILLVKKGESPCCSLQNIKVNKYDSPPIDLTKFTFKGKGFMHYIVLFLTILIPIFIVINLVKCVRTKNLKRKWLWFLFILVGIYGVTFNWYTGQIGMSLITKTETGIHINFINFNILGAGVTKSGPFEPWLFELGFPLGAIIFWFKSKKLARTKNDTVTENE